MAGPLKVTQRNCRQCQKPTAFERSSTTWGAGDLLMILLTFGAWLVAKFGWHALTNPWRCKQCGARA